MGIIGATPGASVECFTTEAGLGVGQSVGFYSHKTTWPLISVGPISSVSFPAPAVAPYDVSGLAIHDVDNAAGLHCWAIGDTGNRTLSFRIVWAGPGGVRRCASQAYGLATGDAMNASGQFLTSGYDVDITTQSHTAFAVWVTALSGGTWTLYFQPY